MQGRERDGESERENECRRTKAESPNKVPFVVVAVAFSTLRENHRQRGLCKFLGKFFA